MTNTCTLAIDAMGGDFGPPVVIPAAAAAAKKDPSLRFIFFGDERQINHVLGKYADLSARSEIRHTEKAISSHDKPSIAVRQGKGSSMRMAIEAVKEGQADAVVSAGNTGALMAMSKMILKSLPGIERPAIASVIPTMQGRSVMLDLGANLSCDAEVLAQFAVLGSVYAKIIMGIAAPSVGLLNVGTEDMKGHEEVRAAHAVLSNVKFPGKYHGFVEGDDIMKGTVDVIVTDGFTGNVALKTMEGVGKFMSNALRETFKSSLFAIIGYSLAARAFTRFKDKVDPRKYNGGMFLGLDGICVKSHGGSDEYGTENAFHVAADLVKNGFNKRVAIDIEKLMSQESFFSSLAGEAAE